jgi:membrane associated rhomboid family serine protease
VRVLARIVCWLVIAVAAFVGVVCVALIVGGDDGDARLGGAVILVLALGALAGAWAGLRAIKRHEATQPAVDLADLQRRLRAGEPVVLHPRTGRRVLLFAFAIVLTLGTVVFALAAPSVVVSVIAGLFAALFLFATIELTPGTGSLRIAPDGLTARTTLRRRHWAWNDIEHFQGYEIQSGYSTTRLVGFDRRALTPQRQGVWRTINRGMSGVDETLPDTYGLPHDALAELLGEARKRYATEHGMSESERADRALAAQVERIPQDRLPLVTAALALGCVAVFVSEASRFGLFPDADELLGAGGASGDAPWWTLLTANVLHGNPIHLVLNLVALIVLGWLLERELGWLRFGLLCLVAGVAAMGLAILIQPNAVTVGVSGVLFGIAGFALVRDTHRTRALGAVAWSIVPVGLIYTFLTPHVSIGAHLGGLLAGLAVGFLHARRVTERRTGGISDAWLPTSRRSPSG